MPRFVRKIFRPASRTAAAVLAATWLAAAPAAPPALGQEPDDPMAEPSAELIARARALLAEAPLIDGHNDLPWQYRERVGNRLADLDIGERREDLDPPLHTDIPRLREGGLGAQFWSVYVPASLSGPEAATAVLEQMDVVYRLAERYPDTFEMAYTGDDVRRIFAAGKVASLIGVEGGGAIDGSLAVLRQLYRGGARYMTLSHSSNLAWADSATDEPKLGGLSDFGREVVREMNRVGMLVDLSHVSADAMHDALDATAAPVIFSHSSARALDSHPRNVPDDVLERLPENGGVVMVTFVEIFVSEEARQYWARHEAEDARLGSLHPGDPEAAAAELERWEAENAFPRATYRQVADHIDHVREVAGIDHIGIGSDFDGIPRAPLGLEAVDAYPRLFAELLRRGYSGDDVKKIAGGNVLRVMDRVEAVARELRAARPASDSAMDDAE